MAERDAAAMLENLVAAAPDDFASMLIDLQSEEGENSREFMDLVLSIYQQTINTLEPTAAVYASTVEILNPVEIGTYATKTNR
jgi:hypothetical protein